jgi:hypothetical protein
MSIHGSSAAPIPTEQEAKPVVVFEDPERAAYHAAIVECDRLRKAVSPTVTVGGREIARFLRMNDRDDGTLRCIACGQIDDEPWHKPSLCFGLAGLGATTAPEASAVGTSVASEPKVSS